MTSPTYQFYIGSLVPGVHPAFRPSSIPGSAITNIYVYLTSWCLTHGIVVDKAWLHDNSSNFIIRVDIDGQQAAENALGQHLIETTLRSYPGGLPKGIACSFYRCTLPETSFRKERFFLNKWPPSFSKVTAAKTEDEKRRAVASSSAALRAAFDLFEPNPPPPVKVASTPDIKVGWYLPLSTSTAALTASSSTTAAPIVASPLDAVVGDKRKRGAIEDSSDCSPRAKRFKGADPGPVEDRMEGVTSTSTANDMMDIALESDAIMEDVQPTATGGDEMDVDFEPHVADDLNGRIGRHMFGVPHFEFVAERITYLS